MVSPCWRNEHGHLFILLEQSKIMETRTSWGNLLTFQVLKETTTLCRCNKHINFLQKLFVLKHPCRQRSGCDFLLSLFLLVQSKKFNDLTKSCFDIKDYFRFTDLCAAEQGLQGCAFGFLLQQSLVYCGNTEFWPRCCLGCCF